MTNLGLKLVALFGPPLLLAAFVAGRASAPVRTVEKVTTVETAAKAEAAKATAATTRIATAGPVTVVTKRVRVLVPGKGCEETTTTERTEGAKETRTAANTTAETLRTEERTRAQERVVVSNGARPDRWGIWARARFPLLSFTPTFDSAGASVRIVGPIWADAGWQAGNRLLLGARVTW